MNTQLDKIVQEAAEKLSPFGTHWPKNSEAWVLAKRKWQDKIKCDSAIIRRAIADAVRETGAEEALAGAIDPRPSFRWPTCAH